MIGAFWEWSGLGTGGRTLDVFLALRYDSCFPGSRVIIHDPTKHETGTSNSTLCAVETGGVQYYFSALSALGVCKRARSPFGSGGWPDSPRGGGLPGLI